MNGAEAIVKTLIGEKTKHVFGFPGGSVIPLYDEFLNYTKEIKHVLVRHEQGAAHAAEGYARASGKAGVCIATSGPGATNLVTGIMDAYMDSVPIIAFAGQVPTTLIGNDAFQESDMMGITAPITKHNFQIRDSNQIEATIKKAFTIAMNGRPGPVFIDLPKDAQTNKVTKKVNHVMIRGFKPNLKGHPKQIKAAAEMILKAERPVILAGGGILHSSAYNELLSLAEKFGIPVTTTFMGKSVFPESHPLSLGVLGMHGRKVANYAIVNADVLIAVGCRFSDRITGNLDTFLQDSKVIHIDIDSAEIGKNVAVDLPIQGDAKLVLGDLLKMMKKKALKSKEWNNKIKNLIRECQCDQDIDDNPPDPRRVLFELQKLISDKDIVTTGVGQQQMFASHFLKREKPRTFISSGGAGTMGFGLPAAMGAKTAKPDVNVIDFDGDGSFAMTQQELATCKEEGINVKAVIMNNAYLGMVRQWLELFYDKRYSQVYLNRNPDFEKIAQAHSLNGHTVTRSSQIYPALKEAFKEDEASVIDIQVAEESNILPMFAAGKNVDDMFGWCIPKKYFR